MLKHEDLPPALRENEVPPIIQELPLLDEVPEPPAPPPEPNTEPPAEPFLRRT